MYADGKSYMGLSHGRLIIIWIISDPSSTHGLYGNIKWVITAAHLYKGRTL